MLPLFAPLRRFLRESEEDFLRLAVDYFPGDHNAGRPTRETSNAAEMTRRFGARMDRGHAGANPERADAGCAPWETLRPRGASALTLAPATGGPAEVIRQD